MTETDKKRDSDETNVVPKKKVKITDFFSVSKKAEKKVASSEVQRSEQKVTVEQTKVAQTDHQPKDTGAKTNISTRTVSTSETGDVDYEEFAIRNGFNKQEWVDSLSEDNKALLALEIQYLHISWLTFLHKELTKPYFLKLKRFLQAQRHKTVFPPENQIYSWSYHTPLPQVKCLILGQDPYHNFNQAHGLAFSVLEPTKPPPSLKNIYKGLANDYPKFQQPDSSRGGGGNLTKWAKRGVFMLNTCLTVEAHKPNSHSKQGWETFTQQVIQTAIDYHSQQPESGFVVMAWGMPAQNNIAKFSGVDNKDKFLIIKTFHPSPFSAAKGFFTSQSFKRCNDWLEQRGRTPIDWSLVDGNDIF